MPRQTSLRAGATPAAHGSYSGNEAREQRQSSVLAAAHFRTWLLQPSGPKVNHGCVWWTHPPVAHPLVHGVRRCVPEVLAHQVRGVHWRWGLLICDGNGFPLPLWARFSAKAIEVSR